MMQLKEIMTHNPEVIHPEAPLREAAQKMRALEVGAMPVCDGDKLVGMLTDRDVTVRATAGGCDPTRTQVRAIMSSAVVYCFEDQDVTEAAQLMADQQIRRLPILNHNKRLVGIVSLEDLAVGGSDPQLAGETLKQVSKLAGPQR
jgi:CBS domain-containing protein